LRKHCWTRHCGRPSPPADSFDAYAVSGYFGLDIGTADLAPTLHDWIADGTATARVTERLRDGSFGELLHEQWPYQAAVAAERGLQLVMYEGGTHVVGLGDVTADDDVTAFFTTYNYSAEMAALYAELIAAWRDLGDTVPVGPFNAFVDVAAPSRWGSWGALRHLDDMNPRWATLVAWNSLPAGTAMRAPDAFLHGVIRQGGDIGDLIGGTPARDLLLGGPGDDILVTNGGTDRIDGGSGHDRAVLPGTAADWTPAFADDVLWMLGQPDAVRLIGVEEVTFTDEPAAVLTVEPPQADATAAAEDQE